MNKQVVVERIEEQAERRRAIAFGANDPKYAIILDMPHPTVRVGDLVEYEPYGVNFGFYVRTIQQ